MGVVVSALPAMLVALAWIAGSGDEKASHQLGMHTTGRAALCQGWTLFIGAEAGRPRLVRAKLASRCLVRRGSAMRRTPQEVSGRHARARGDGNVDWLIRVQAVSWPYWTTDERQPGKEVRR